MATQSEAKPRLSIGEALAGHRNSLGLIRLVLAIAVIFDHAFPLGGFGADPVHSLTNGQATIGSIAVDGFFGISGYLIAKSGASSDVVQFLWRRFLRIFPAYWGALLVAAVIVGPIFWAIAGNNVAQYFSTDGLGPLGYLKHNWTLRVGQYGIYDIFQTTTPWGEHTGMSVFNGSIWTLEYEWFSYMIIAVLCIGGILVRGRIMVPVLTAAFVVLQFMNTVTPGASAQIFPFLSDGYRVSLPLVFMVGACIAMYSKSVPFDWRLALLSGLAVLATLKYGGYAIIGSAALTYLVLWLGAALPKKVQWIGQKNDYSYGIYVYGFLVQQCLAYFKVYEWGYFPYVALTIVITWALAWVSWHGIEKWAMRIKDWGPGQGIRFWFDRIKSLFAKD